MPNAIEELYETDFYAWTQANAQAIRALGKLRLNLDVDLEHAAEEIADLGKSDRREANSRVTTIIEHMLKLEYSPAREPRAAWRRTVLEARFRAEEVLTPSLRRSVAHDLKRLWRNASVLAREGMSPFGETADLPSVDGPCRLSLNEVLREDGWLANRHGLVDPQ